MKILLWLLLFASPVLAQAPVSITDYGAQCDGVNDDRPAYLAAMAASLNVYIPAGSCLMNNSAGYIEVDNWNGMLTFLGGASVLLTDNTKGGLLFSGGTGAVINNLTLTYVTIPPVRTGQHAVLFSGTTDTTVNGAHVVGAPQGGLKFDSGIRPKLRGINIIGSTSDGLAIYNCQDAEIVNATISNSGDDGFSFVNYTSNANYTGGLATNISVTNSRAAGIKIAGQSGVVISNFRINGTASDGVHVQTDSGTRVATNVKIGHGLIEGAGMVTPTVGNGWGVEVSSAGSVDIDNVSVVSAAGIGIGGSSNTRMRVANSRVIGNGSAAYEIDNNTDVVMENLTSHDSPVYAFVIMNATRAIVSNLTAINAFKNGAPHRAFHFSGNAIIMADGLHIIDDQNPATGYQIYEATNGAGTLANMTYQILHGTFSFSNGSADVKGFTVH